MAATKSKSSNGSVNRIADVEPRGVALTIKPPEMAVLKVLIEGTSPYCQSRFSAKAMQMMKAKQEAGSTAKKGTTRAPKDFQQCYEDAKHKSTEGWVGIPAGAFRTAMISACRTIGFKMTLAKLAIFVVQDGIDAVDRTPLVRISKGEPQYLETAMRNQTGVADIRARPVWDIGWQAVVTLRFDTNIFTAEDAINLLARVGLQVGIGEGRPDSRESSGCGWGLFEIKGIVE